MMKKFINVLLICLVLMFIGIEKDVVITSTYGFKLDANEASCPGSATCCESGYNVMCHMVDPIKNYHVTSTVCSNRSGVYHKGVDLTTSGNGDIFAVFDGVVIATTDNGENCKPSEGTLSCSPINCKSSRGISVTLRVTDPRFDGYTVHYLHMSSRTVNVGDTVKQGDKVGVIGNTGCSTGRHLHFQINNYNNDTVVINSYFVDKTAYSCGGVNAGDVISSKDDFLSDKILLKSSNGYKYNAIIGNCVGNNQGSFQEGIELKTNGSVANVFNVESGIVIDKTTSNCINGISILSESNRVYTYCNLDDKPSFKVGNYVSSSMLLGSIGKYGDSKLVFSVKKYANYIDTSTSFLRMYGGSCDNNRNRKNCNRVTNLIENYACKQVFG